MLIEKLLERDYIKRNLNNLPGWIRRSSDVFLYLIEDNFKNNFVRNIYNFAPSLYVTYTQVQVRFLATQHTFPAHVLLVILLRNVAQMVKPGSKK